MSAFDISDNLTCHDQLKFQTPSDHVLQGRRAFIAALVDSGPTGLRGSKMQKLTRQSLLACCCWAAMLVGSCQAMWTADCLPTNVSSPILEAAYSGNGTAVVEAITTALVNASLGTPPAEQVATADSLQFAQLLASALYPYQPPEGCASSPGQPSPLNTTQAEALGKGLAALLTDPDLSCSGMDSLGSKIIRGMAYAMEQCTGPMMMGPGSEVVPFKFRIQPQCCYVAGPTLAATLYNVEVASDRRALRALASAMTQLYDAQSVGAAVYDLSMCVMAPCNLSLSDGQGCCDANYTMTTCSSALSRLQGNASVVSLADPMPVEVGTARLWAGAHATLPGSLAGTCRCPDLMTMGGGYLGTRIPESLRRRVLAAAGQLHVEMTEATALT